MSHPFPKQLSPIFPAFSSFSPTSVFSKPLDALMDKTAQNEIRKSGLSLYGDPVLIFQEHAVEIKGRESGGRNGSTFERRPWVVVIRVSVGE